MKLDEWEYTEQATSSFEQLEEKTYGCCAPLHIDGLATEGLSSQENRNNSGVTF